MRIVGFIAAVVLVGIVVLSCGSGTGAGDRAAAEGYRLQSAGKHAEAARAFETAIDKGVSEERIEMVYTCLGNAYNELEQFEKAVEAHRKALDVNPEFHKAWVNLGVVYRLSGNFIEAEKCYMRALELQPDYAELHASMGALHIFQGKYNQAVQHLEKATELDGQLPVAWSNLALAYASVGKLTQADTALKKAIVLGYKDGLVIRERIDNLKAASGGAK